MKARATTCLLATCLLLAGCQRYIVTDTRTGQQYLAAGILDDVSGPGIRFKDGVTGEDVRVPAYKLEIINDAAYQDVKRTGRFP